MQEIKENPFAKEVQAVLDPEVIKIRTIKRKHLDEVREAEYPPMERAEILGYTGHFVLFRIKSLHPDGPISHLLKVSNMKLISYTLTQRQKAQTERLTADQVEDIREEVWDYLEKGMHQLFVE